ncbi:MAG: dehydrogenase [Microvirga sp.]|jgi:predicted dehydrogenase|nr:dehydrogenase [Microvirga sp.]
MKIALLGVSHWHAGIHLDAALFCGGEIVAVWDRDGETARRFAADHQLAADQTLEQILKRRPDLVVLMGHPRHVPEVALEIIAAGVPMLLEKPAAASTEGITRIRDNARENRAFVGVPLPNRFGPIFGEMTRLSGEGRLGGLGHGHFRIINGPPQRYDVDGVGWMLDPSIGGGGALRNLGIHGIDAARSLAQGKLRVASAAIGNRLHDAMVEDHALVALQDEADVLFTVEAGYTYASLAPGGDFEWRVATHNAYLVDRGEEAQCATLDDGALRALRPEPGSTRYRLLMADTFAQLRNGEAPTISIEDYHSAMEIIDAAYQKAGS